ncbi:unnamed protein product [Paramecium pentaurelia]|uniref:Uncharacterized protein n=1 Tax=Paramecium pentaurelia TaxID=43138 RepID=A0A8S1XVW9_9CILI|nr:unnamed protein product [Paramecium pentaurelia]
MFQIQCLSGHNENADFFCAYENCKDNRFHCFNQCIKNDHKHVHNDQYLFKIDEFPNYIKIGNIQFSETIKQLDNIVDDFCFQFKELKQNLQKTFEWTLDRLKCLKGNNLNIAVDNMIKFEEYRKRFMMNINQNTQLLCQTLKESIQELKVKQTDLFQYYLLQQWQIKEKEICKTIAQNQDSSIIICGFQNFIKIYQFKNQSFQEIQVIKQQEALKLFFINDTDGFISLANKINCFGLLTDISIKIDIFQKVNNQWQKQHSIDSPFIPQQLFITKDESFILLSQTINLIIKQISITMYQKFNDQKWIYQKEQFQEIRGFEFFNADMNDSENIIIFSCESKIQILQKQYQAKKWDLIQKIKIQEKQPQIKFIQDKSFISSENSQLCIYTQNQDNLQFEKIKSINFQTGKIISNNIIIIQFIKQKQLLLISINSKLNIIKVYQNNDLKIEYCVEDGKLEGMISNDGNVLLTYDQDSKQIAIRQL